MHDDISVGGARRELGVGVAAEEQRDGDPGQEDRGTRVHRNTKHRWLLGMASGLPRLPSWQQMRLGQQAWTGSEALSQEGGAWSLEGPHGSVLLGPLLQRGHPQDQKDAPTWRLHLSCYMGTLNPESLSQTCQTHFHYASSQGLAPLQYVPKGWLSVCASAEVGSPYRMPI